MKLIMENWRRFVAESNFSGNGPLSEPIEEMDPRTVPGSHREIDKDGDEDDAAELLDMTRDMLISQIRQGSKDLYGRRAADGEYEDLEQMSIDQLEDILFDQGSSPEQAAIDDAYRDEEEDEMGRDHQLSDLEMSPKQAGHGRMPGGRPLLQKRR